MCNIKYLNVYRNETNGNGNLDALYFTVFKDIPNISLEIFVKLTKSNYVLVDYTINLCHIEKNRRRNIFVRFWMDELLNSFDFKPKCPMKKGIYTIKQRATNHGKQSAFYIPSLFRFNDSFEALLTGHTKIQNERVDMFKIDEMWTIEFN